MVCDILQNVFTKEELDASSITDRTAKTNFLKKLIKALNDDGSLKDVKAAKIVAGKEPELTNLVSIALISFFFFLNLPTSASLFKMSWNSLVLFSNFQMLQKLAIRAASFRNYQMNGSAKEEKLKKDKKEHKKERKNKSEERKNNHDDSKQVVLNISL